jgi:hypothetical protein
VGFADLGDGLVLLRMKLGTSEIFSQLMAMELQVGFGRVDQSRFCDGLSPLEALSFLDSRAPVPSGEVRRIFAGHRRAGDGPGAIEVVA